MTERRTRSKAQAEKIAISTAPPAGRIIAVEVGCNSLATGDFWVDYCRVQLIESRHDTATGYVEHHAVWVGPEGLLVADDDPLAGMSNVAHQIVSADWPATEDAERLADVVEEMRDVLAWRLRETEQRQGVCR